jgi:hypothetical protein
VLKSVVVGGGDVVEIGPEAVIVNGQRLPSSPTAASDSLVPHAARGRHVVGADERLVGTRIPNSWSPS